MTRVAVLALAAAALAAPPAEAAAPSLAAAFGAPLASVQDPLAVEAFADPTATPDPRELERVRYQRARRTHTAGLATATIGAAALFPGATLWLSGLIGGDTRLSTSGAVLSIAAMGAILGGEVASLSASLQASSAIERAFGRKVPRGLAYAGIGLFAGGLALSPISSGLTALVGVVGGLGLSIGQMSVAGRTLDELGVAELRLVPTPRGIAVVARF